jgi:hypothetical protein
MKNAFVSSSFLAMTLLLSRAVEAFYNTGCASSFGMTTTRSSSHSLYISRQQQERHTRSRLFAVVTEERTETDRRTTPRRRRTSREYRENDNDDDNDDDDDYNDLEYMMDAQASRAWDDPFHILLLGQTFEQKNPTKKITISYVASSLEYVLTMPRDEAMELCTFAKTHGLSCLGTWPREECLTLGRQLQVRDIECRVVPFCPGGQRGWQAKDSSSSSSSNAAAGGGANNDKVSQGV